MADRAAVGKELMRQSSREYHRTMAESIAFAEVPSFNDRHAERRQKTRADIPVTMQHDRIASRHHEIRDNLRIVNAWQPPLP